MSSTAKTAPGMGYRRQSFKLSAIVFWPSQSNATSGTATYRARPEWERSTKSAVSRCKFYSSFSAVTACVLTFYLVDNKITNRFGCQLKRGLFLWWRGRWARTDIRRCPCLRSNLVPAGKWRPRTDGCTIGSLLLRWKSYQGQVFVEACSAK